MSFFKCKMCGGTIEFEPGATVGVCDSCGTKQTLPRLDDDQRANLYDRANHFRRNNEFDKAMSIYEKILNEDNTDAEAYWSLVLCRYGIEYVEDPATHKRVPTVNRTQYTSIYMDEDYKSAIKYADVYQKTIYEEEAKTIDDIQKGILAISQKEDPFDVFICYKETDNNGRRTQDSVLANDLYHQLTQEGFKVFFARITLEDKLGTAYEPYIFAALNSAKVMVVLGTKQEYFNAVWVKNEWSRYLALVKQSNGQKMLIPAYRDMDPYDLPEEFSHLQAQDMSKLGFMQDLIRGIKKIVGKDEPMTTAKETVVGANASPGANEDPLLERAFMFLEDGEWDKADDFCEQVLNINPKNARAYLGKLMADSHAHKQEDLKNCAYQFDGNNNYQKAIRFGDENLKSELNGYIDHINERNELARLTGLYNEAVEAMNAAGIEDEYKAVAKLFKDISGFKDADSLAEKCLENADVCRKDVIYESGMKFMEEASSSSNAGVFIDQKLEKYEKAVKAFEKIPGWKDSNTKLSECRKKAEEIKTQIEADRLQKEREAEAARIVEEKRRKRNKKIAAIGIPSVVVIGVFLIVLFAVIIPKVKHNKAMGLLESGNYEEAYAMFKELGDEETIKNTPQLNQVMWSRVEVGSIVSFGTYDDNTIEWQVLAKEDNKLLVISKEAICEKPYNDSSTDVTWEACTLRKWLNEDFYNSSFSADEQAKIATTTVKAGKNPSFDTPAGNDTEDKVFLLSIDEVNKYFNSDEDKKCTLAGEACWWWLRSPGRFSDLAAGVYNDGRVINLGDYVNYVIRAVRPALWINLDS